MLNNYFLKKEIAEKGFFSTTKETFLLHRNMNSLQNFFKNNFLKISTKNSFNF